MKPLNKAQQEVYDFIAGHIQERGESPKLKQIVDKFNLVSRDAAYQRTQVLVQKGWLVRKGRQLRLAEVKSDGEIRIDGERYKIGLHGFVFRWADGWFKSERSVAEIKRAQRASLRCV